MVWVACCMVFFLDFEMYEIYHTDQQECDPQVHALAV